MNKPDTSFRDKVYEVVAMIPERRVMTYGDIAACAGHAYAARIVGGLAHYGPPELPWQRVVNRFGGLASGYPGGREAHRRDLKHEGVSCTEYRVDNFEKLRWNP